MTRVLVVARCAPARARLEALVARSPALRLVSGAAGVPLDRQVSDLRPDVLLVDLDAARLEAALAHVSLGPSAPVVVLLTAAPRPLLNAQAMERGVRAVLPREATSGEILAAIEAIAAGLVALHPDALGALRRRPPRSARAEPMPGPQALTARELEVLGVMAEGLGNKIIASRLGISTHTAKFHVASIMAKLGAGSRTEAVTIGVRLGLVPI